jgi:hypothetical protein
MQCLDEVRLWMAMNYLKLNDDKTEFIILGSKHNLRTVTTTHLTIGENKVKPSKCVKNIGATFDEHMKLDKHVAITCRNAWHHLYQISKIKKYLSEPQLKSVIQSFVISKIDQNNSLLSGSPKCLIAKLQSIQNAAAKLICGMNHYDQIEPPLRNLHWLPVKRRIQFKILLLCYKCLHEKGPAYLTELLVPYKPGRSLRSASSNLLVEPKSSMKTYGDRAFSVAGPRLWNDLPSSIKDSRSISSFKKALKTHLFKLELKNSP